VLLFVLVRSLSYLRRLRQPDRPWDEEMHRRGATMLLAQPLRQWFAYVVRPLVDRLAGGPSPDTLTGLCLGLSVAAAALVASGMLATGSAVALLGASLDYFDGKVARRRGVSNQAGNFLDSTLDRWSEVALFTGAALLLRRFPVALAACVVGQGASLIVSYARAKAESLSLPLRGGLMQRPERLVLFCGGGLLAPYLDLVLPARWGPWILFRAAVVVLGAATTFTAASRTLQGYRALRRAPEPGSRPVAAGPDGGRPPV